MNELVKELTYDEYRELFHDRFFPRYGNDLIYLDDGNVIDKKRLERRKLLGQKRMGWRKRRMAILLRNRIPSGV